LKAINLGSNPVQTKIYNQKIVKDISINRITEPVVNNIKYITSLSSNANISITAETVNPQPNANPTDTLVQAPSTLQSAGTGTSGLQVFDNGLARVMIPKSAVFLKFVLFQKNNGQNSTMNLSGLGDLYIVFNSTANDTVEFIEYPNPYTSKTNGEVVFRLSANEANKVLGLSDRSFQIFLQNDGGDRTFLYAGEFFSTNEFQKLKKENRIVQLEYQVQELSKQIADLGTLSSTQQQTIQNITNSNAQLQQSLSDAVQQAAQEDEQTAVDTIKAQAQQIDELKNQVQSLSDTVTSLTDALTLNANALASANGLLQMNTQNNNTENQTKTKNKLTKQAANVIKNAASNQSPK